MSKPSAPNTLEIAGQPAVISYVSELGANGGLPPNESENRYWKNSNVVASFC
ncbi:hypothetical protein RF240_19105 [Dickeya dadantii]|uniref:hypothetical protein n=1 Tax=Dickeya dadantii TaxID=204038 RepID=UPI0035A9919F